jgi:hypothetical protein
MSNSGPDHPRRPGRPRKYASTAERVSVFRSVHGLCKVTVDVPRQFAGQLREHARELRKMASEPSREFEEGDLGAANRLTPKQATESYVMSMRWTRVARGVHFLHGPSHWITADITRSLQKYDSQLLWSWCVEDKQLKQTIAQGHSVALGRAKEMTIAVVRSYLENDEYFYARFVYLESRERQLQ